MRGRMDCIAGERHWGGHGGGGCIQQGTAEGLGQVLTSSGS